MMQEKGQSHDMFGPLDKNKLRFKVQSHDMYSIYVHSRLKDKTHVASWGIEEKERGQKYAKCRLSVRAPDLSST